MDKYNFGKYFESIRRQVEFLTRGPTDLSVDSLDYFFGEQTLCLYRQTFPSYWGQVESFSIYVDFQIETSIVRYAFWDAKPVFADRLLIKEGKPPQTIVPTIFVSYFNLGFSEFESQWNSWNQGLIPMKHPDYDPPKSRKFDELHQISMEQKRLLTVISWEASMSGHIAALENKWSGFWKSLESKAHENMIVKSKVREIWPFEIEYISLDDLSYFDCPTERQGDAP